MGLKIELQPITVARVVNPSSLKPIVRPAVLQTHPITISAMPVAIACKLETLNQRLLLGFRQKCEDTRIEPDAAAGGQQYGGDDKQQPGSQTIGSFRGKGDRR